MSPTFFASQAEFHDWLANHCARESELLVGFNKVRSGLGGLTYKQALDEALGHGWIDGHRKGLDEHRWTIRFSPRKPKSIWSRVNLKRYAELEAMGLIRESGKAAFESRDPARSGKYSYEQEGVGLTEDYEARFQDDPAAWEFFSHQPPSYRKLAIWWVISAKAEETRSRRLDTLMECSRNAERLPLLRWKKKT